MAKYSVKQIGVPGTESYSMYIVKSNTPISFMHDIPLWVNKNERIVNMVVEIPKGSHAKLEISKSNKLNPIKQDIKNGKLRYVHDAYPFNYGALPQTWENPFIADDITNANGDNDPIDICEIGSKIHKSGDIIQVKILGIYAMIDDGETDWKVIGIDITDPLFASIDSVPEAKSKIIYNFLRDYKIPDGGAANTFGLDNKLGDSKLAMHVINKTHEEWVKLVTGRINQTDIETSSSTLKSNSGEIKHLSKSEAIIAITHAFIKYVIN